MEIGNDADYNMFKNFVSEDTEEISGTNKLCFKAEYATYIVKDFKLISVAITVSASSNKNDFPTKNAPSRPTSNSVDDDPFIRR